MLNNSKSEAGDCVSITGEKISGQGCCGREEKRENPKEIDCTKVLKLKRLRRR